MTIPGFQDVTLPILEEVGRRGECRTSDLVETIADRFGLTPEERTALLPSRRQTVIANRVHWAIAYLGKALLLERTRRAHYQIAERGKAVLAKPPARIDLKFLERYPEIAAFRGDNGRIAEVTPATTEITPEEVIRAAHQQIEAALRDELLERITASTPARFERLVVELLKAMGFRGEHGGKAEAIGRAGDDGLDGVIDQDALGLDRVYLQAKRYARDNPVGSGAIRDFFGSLDIAKAAKGVFITTSTFTRSAREAVERLGKRIVLIDGEQLATLMVRYGVGVRIEETFHVKKVDEDFFLE